MNNRPDTAAEVHDYLTRFAAAERAKLMPPLTEAEYAAIEQIFADAPETPGMTDADAEAMFDARRAEFGDWGEDDYNPNDSAGF